MVAERQPRAVVGGINNVGVVGEFQFIQRFEQAPHLGVNVLDGVDVGVLGVRIAQLVGYIQRDVRHGVWEVHEEGLVFVVLDEIDGLLGVAASDGALVHGQLDDSLVLEQWCLPLVEGGLGIVPEDVHAFPTATGFALVVGMVHVVRVRDAIIGVEAIGGGQHFLVMTEVPFPETGGGIALRLQVIGDGVLLRV